MSAEERLAAARERESVAWYRLDGAERVMPPREVERLRAEWQAADRDVRALVAEVAGH